MTSVPKQFIILALASLSGYVGLTGRCSSSVCPTTETTKEMDENNIPDCGIYLYQNYASKLISLNVVP